MSERMSLDVHVRAHDDASPIIKKIRAEVVALRSAMGKIGRFSIGNLSTSVDSTRALAANQRTDANALRSLKSKFAFEARMTRQRAASDRDAAREAETTRRSAIRADADAMRALRQRVAVSSAMIRQRAAEERSAAAEAARGERERVSAIRESIRLDNYRMRLRARHERDVERDQRRDRSERVSNGRDGMHAGRDAVTRTSRGIAATAAIGAAGTGMLVRKSLGIEGDVDAAEINARIYGKLTKSAARDLREQWAEPMAEQLGIGTEKLLTAYVDALKLGIPSEGAKSFAGLATKTSEAWGVSFEGVSDILGTVNSILTSDGSAFDFSKIKATANAIQHLAQAQSTTPQKLIAFLERGAGAAQVLGMSQSAGVAFGSASTSLGNQASESGRLYDYTASKLVDLPKLVKKRGDEGKDARELVRALGYGSADAMDRERRDGPDKFLPDFFERFSKISDPRVQERGMRSFFGREWFGEGSRLVKGFDTYREAARLERESRGIDAIEEVWQLHVEKLSFTGKSIVAGLKNIGGEIGKLIGPFAQDIGRQFLAWTGKLRETGALRNRLSAAADGLMQGLGFKSAAELIESILGKPGDGQAGAIEVWRETFKGIGAGLRDIGQAIKGVIGVFAGADASAETIARWSVRIAGLAAALVLLSPVLGILGSLATFVAGMTSAVAGAGAAVGWAFVGTTIASAFVAFLIGQGPALLDRLTGKKFGSAVDSAKESGGWFGLPGYGLGVIQELMRSLVDKTDDQAKAIEGNARVLKQSFESNENGVAPFIRKASLGGEDGVRSAIDRMGAKIQTASLGGLSGVAAGITGSSAATYGGAGSSVAGLLNGTPGQRLGPSALGRRRIFGGGGGGGSSSMVGYGANPGAYKPLLDHIAQSEGTAGQAGGGYNTSLGYGRYLPGGKEQDLTSKSLNEILALGDHMRRQPGNPNSSALGRYQIVGNTLRGLMTKLGLKGTDKFDEAMQDRLGATLAQQRGANGSLESEWASLHGVPLTKAIALAGAIPRGSSTIPGQRPAGVDSVAGATLNMPGGNPADIARRYKGMHELRNRGELAKFLGHDPAGEANAWCASFVNSSLKAVGQQGSGSNIANSFLRWGREISAEMVGKGDVLVEHRNRGVDAKSGHVGLATGNKRLNDRGELELEVVQGNSSSRVKTEWERASKLIARRSNQVTEAGAIGIKNGSFNPGVGAAAAAAGQIKPGSLSSTVNESVTERARNQGASAGGGKAMTISAPITIQGSTNPEHIANRAAKHLQDSTLWRTHDSEWQSA